jgi:hypothetical protein
LQIELPVARLRRCCEVSRARISGLKGLLAEARVGRLSARVEAPSSVGCFSFIRGGAQR